ncbi:hypothetical protein [Methylobacterium nigriterrae]|uniref:hypothetical protein n=1 Tax=Methylobacterium nigriterrae TaxID=3127512 RepID=UPI0030141258
MKAQLLPVILTASFVAGCLTIQALSRWPDRVRNGLGVCLCAVVSLLVVEMVLEYAPRQSAYRAVEPVASATALYGGVTATLQAAGP